MVINQVYLVGGLVAIATCYLLFFTRKSGAPTSLDQKEYRKFKLSQKENVSHNTIRFRFDLPSSEHVLGLPVGRHIVLRFTDKDGKPVSRQYTPITGEDQRGYFDLVIKIYEDGKMGQHLKHLPVGQTVEVRGPLGKLSYRGQGQIDIKRSRDNVQQAKVQKLGLIAGGTGLTPMLQIARAVLADPADRTQVALIFANQTEEDILLREELEGMAERDSRFKIIFSVDRPNDGWTGESGFVTADTIARHLPGPSESSLVLFCGPPPMCNAMKRNLAALDFEENHFFEY